MELNGTSDLVLVEQIGSILRVQMNRPKKKNALFGEMYHAISDALEQADADPAIHVVYITGSGDSFSAGNDLTRFIANPSDPAPGRFITQISKTATPIVAAVNGVAVGVGVTMLLHCDLVYAVENAKFNFAFIDLGAVPEAGSSYLLPQMIGQRRAAELLMLGEKFDAETAQQIGIVNRVVSAEKLENTAWDVALRLAQKPPQALLQTKQLMKRGMADAVAETIPHEMEQFVERIASPEAQEIIQGIMLRAAAKYKSSEQ